MDTELVNEIRDKVQPAVKQLIALAAERGLSVIEICQDGMEITVSCPPTAMVGPLEAEDADAQAATAVEEHKMLPVLSTLVGIFKTRPVPEKPPVTVVGTQVEQGQVLGYVESMSLTYEIHAPTGGRLAEVLVEEGHPVEYGQPLVVLEATE